MLAPSLHIESTDSMILLEGGGGGAEKSLLYSVLYLNLLCAFLISTVYVLKCDLDLSHDITHHPMCKGINSHGTIMLYPLLSLFSPHICAYISKCIVSCVHHQQRPVQRFPH